MQKGRAILDASANPLAYGDEDHEKNGHNGPVHDACGDQGTLERPDGTGRQPRRGDVEGWIGFCSTPVFMMWG